MSALDLLLEQIILKALYSSSFSTLLVDLFDLVYVHKVFLEENKQYGIIFDFYLVRAR